MLDSAYLRAHADLIRASQVLGRSGLMRRLFDFLLECSLAGKAPKEIEVAVDVFGRDAGFETTQDAMVRVYIHKLRRKLDEFYAGAGRHENGRLSIPKGEYRLVFEAAPIISAPNEVGAEPEPPRSVGGDSAQSARDSPGTAGSIPIPRSRRRYWIAGMLVLMLANVGLWFFTPPSIPSSIQDLVRVRSSGVWAPLLRDDLPVYVVVGDYYLFGELDDRSQDVRRLVRDFDINSRNDLEQFLKNHPELADRYMDVSLQYLPISVAYALRNVMPLLEPEPDRRRTRQIRVVLASDMTPDMIKSSHIIYIGLISGMGILRDVAFSGSQLKIGDSFDELIDRHTQQHYFSQAGIIVDQRTRYRDYGYFSTFDGPGGNRIVILAGTRDVALMHTAEALSHAASLEHLEKQARVTANFEALYSVEALDRMNLDGRLILTNALDTSSMWTGGRVPPRAVETGAAHPNS